MSSGPDRAEPGRPRLVLLGDGESPHLAKWARALAPRVDLWAASSRGFAPEFAAVVAGERCLALDTRPRFEGGNVRVLRSVPRLAGWLRQVRPDWIHAHYLTSHGTLAWLATRLLRAPGRIVGSAWGSDILKTPLESRAALELTRRVLAACTLATSDSGHMAERMREMGAGEVMCFPFGLEALPPPPGRKEPGLFFANRSLEPVYAPDRVVAAFAGIAAAWPEARLAVANDGSLAGALRAQVESLGLAARVRWLGRLDAATQAGWYARATWFLSLPRSDGLSVSLLEAMAHGCVPLLSDLPANREVVQHLANGLIVGDPAQLPLTEMNYLRDRAGQIARQNHAWIGRHAMFPAAVERFVARLQALEPGR